jgi:electron transport complex protein RnfD
MGEVSALAILIGGCFLIWKKIISPAIPVSFIGAVFVFSLIYYGVKGGDYNALHMAIFHVCAGGVMFGAFFCATDYVTSPIMTKSRIIYGILCGVITMIIRLFASYPEGVSFAILFMNMCTPLLDDFVIKRTYGGAFK